LVTLGVPATPILLQAGIDTSMGSVGDACYNALMERSGCTELS
jgi:hypothetical protein